MILSNLQLQRNLHFPPILHLFWGPCSNRSGLKPPKYFQAQFHISSGPPLICKQTPFIYKQPALSQLAGSRNVVSAVSRQKPSDTTLQLPNTLTSSVLTMLPIRFTEGRQSLLSLFPLTSTCLSINWIYRQFTENYNDTLQAVDFPSVCITLQVQHKSTDFITNRKYSSYCKHVQQFLTDYIPGEHTSPDDSASGQVLKKKMMAISYLHKSVWDWNESEYSPLSCYLLHSKSALILTCCVTALTFLWSHISLPIPGSLANTWSTKQFNIQL